MDWKRDCGFVRKAWDGMENHLGSNEDGLDVPICSKRTKQYEQKTHREPTREGWDGKNKSKKVRTDCVLVGGLKRQPCLGRMRQRQLLLSHARPAVTRNHTT